MNQLVKTLLSMLINWATPIACALGVYYHLEADDSFYPEYRPLYPAAATFIAAFFVCSGHATVFSSLLDTLFVCAMQDIENSKPDPPRLMPPGLRTAFGVGKAPADTAESAEYGRGNKVAPDTTAEAAAPPPPRAGGGG